jgi:O-antigen/teichoic acid export membrane protein
MNLKITIASTLLLVLPLMVFGRFIIERWAGRAAVPPAALLLWMGLWSLIYSAMNSQSCLLSGSGRVKIQTIYSAVAALVNLGLSLVLVQRMGLVGVIIGTVGAYLICIVVPQTIQVERSLRG